MKLEDNTQYRYTPNPGTVNEDVFCGVCGTKTEVTRGLNGPRTYVESMTGFKSDYDMFLCPHSTAKWHMKVVDLHREARSCVSEWMKAMNYAEAARLIQASIGQRGQDL